jgi:prepilin-type N-terminal cleavage/methylation domain-containing protein
MQRPSFILMRTTFNRRREHGLSLVELMIAMAIGLAIIAGIGYVYLQGRSGFTAQDNISRLQDEKRFVVDLMTQDLRMARYMGCQVIGDKAPNNPIPATSFNLRLTGYQPYFGTVGGLSSDRWLVKSGDASTDTRGAINISYLFRGFDNGVGMPTTAIISARREPGTDAVMMMKIGGEARHTVSAEKTATEIEIVGDLIPGYTQNGQIAVVALSSCESGVEIFKASVQGGGRRFSLDNTLNGSLGESSSLQGQVRTNMGKGATLARFEPVMYYISAAANNLSTGLPTLTRVTIADRKANNNDNGPWEDANGGTAVAAGVENMQFRYQVDSAWLEAADIDARPEGPNYWWQRVTAVEVTLTMISQDANARTSTAASLTAGGAAQTDARLREVVRFTVELPNVFER